MSIMWCNHIIIEDSIDLIDRSQTIYYCQLCHACFELIEEFTFIAQPSSTSP
jgi:hypothetical protein